MKKKLLLAFFLIGALSMLLMSAHYLQPKNTGILIEKPVAKAFWYSILFRIHVLFGIIAIAVGPFSLSTNLRKNKAKLHRQIGYIYSLSVALSGFCGLLVAPFAMGGIMAQSGFFVLSILWLISLYIGITAAIEGTYTSHRRYLLLNYSLTFAAITQRTMLLTAFFTSIPFITIYQWSAWLPWMLNGAIAWYYSNRMSTIDLKQAS